VASNTLGLRRVAPLLAEEYDAAQARGEVAGHGGARNFKVAGDNVETTTADLGLRRAEIRLAEEYDAAQARGEVHRHGGQVPRDVAGHNIPSAADLGLRRDEIHEAQDA
jgi:phage baseplate assembly protein gpV